MGAWGQFSPRLDTAGARSPSKARASSACRDSRTSDNKATWSPNTTGETEARRGSCLKYTRAGSGGLATCHTSQAPMSSGAPRSAALVTPPGTLASPTWTPSVTPEGRRFPVDPVSPLPVPRRQLGAP